MTEINLFPKFLDEAATPVAKKVGNTLSSVWSIVFGGVDSYAAKLELNREQKINNFKNELDEKVSAIPKENLIEPQLHIIGPALEASKYYFGNDELRQMFSNLVAASLDKNKTKETHPSFVEIIKQLSPLDAKNLTLFKITDIYPIAEYIVQKSNGKNQKILQSNVFLNNKEVSDIRLNASSMSNLYRLGLVSIDFSKYFSVGTRYDIFENTSLYKKYEQLKNDTDQLAISKGIVNLTPLGEDFVRICL